MNASQASLISAVIQTIQIGLEPGNLGHCYYVPFNNKKKDGTVVKEVQFILGYKGIIELVNRAGKAVVLSTECVYKKDIFTHQQGLEPVLQHIPFADGNRGEFIGVYAIAKNMIANEKMFVYLPKNEVEKVKNSSKSANSSFSPWKNWYEEMAKKTAVKKLCKLLPLSIEVARQVSTDETVRTKIDKDMSMLPDETNWKENVIDVDPSSEEQKPVSKESSEETDKSAKEKEEIAQNVNLISEKQGKRLYAISTSAGISQDELKKFLSENYGVDSTKKIQKEWYEMICNACEKSPSTVKKCSEVNVEEE